MGVTGTGSLTTEVLGLSISDRTRIVKTINRSDLCTLLRATTGFAQEVIFVCHSFIYHPLSVAFRITCSRLALNRAAAAFATSEPTVPILE